MHFYYISLLLDLLGDYRVSQETLLNHAKLNSLVLQESLNLDAHQLDALFSSALDLSADPQLGLKFGARINMVPQGILGYALMTSPTIGDALTLLVRYHRALLPSVNIELKRQNDELVLLTKAPLLSSGLNRFYCEVIYAGILTAGNMLLGSKHRHASPTSALYLDYSKPDDASMYRTVFGKAVKFSQSYRGLHFDQEKLNISISTSNPAAQEVFRRECERLLPHNETPGEVSDRVKKQLISARLSFPSSREVACKLHMSESTLRRRLAKEGFRFQELLDQVRSKLADEYLVTTQLPISEIAELLGFSDSANFRRAFKRWNNETPADARKRHKLKS